MSKNTLKKVLSTFIAITLAITTLTSCSNKKEKTVVSENQTTVENKETTTNNEATTNNELVVEDTFKHDPVLNELGVEPICKEKVVITVGLCSHAKIDDYEDNAYTKLLEKLGNVDIQVIEYPSGSEGIEKLRMQIAGNEKLPDICIFDLSASEAMSYGEEGYFISLEEYFENSSYYAKEGYAQVLKNSGVDILHEMTTNNGKIWSFPTFIESLSTPTYAKMWVYQPWLDAVGMDAPTNTDEFYDMLYAFKTKDPNGNGKADEIPLIGASVGEGYGGFTYEYIMNAFQESTDQANFLTSTDGVLSVSYTTDEWKEGIKYINKLVEEGLFDPVSFTQDGTSFQTILNTSGDQLAGSFVYNSDSFISEEHASKYNWTLLDPLIGPNGECNCAYKENLPRYNSFISADCEHPEVAFRILDLMCKEEVSLAARYGEQGVNWDYVENLTNDEAFKKEYPQYVANFNNEYAGYPVFFIAYNDVWGEINTATWRNKGVVLQPINQFASYNAGVLNPDLNDSEWQSSLHLQNYLAAKPEEVITTIGYENIDAQAEAEAIALELKEYVHQQISRWATGAGDVEVEWDAYLKTLEQIGLSRYLELSQYAWGK